jgi:hypothetical protein
MNLKTTLTLAALVPLIVLGAAAWSQAAEVGDVTSGQAYFFDRHERGFVRIIGEFTSAGPLDLGAVGVHATLEALLTESDDLSVPGPGGGELVSPLPLVLTPRTRSKRVTVFETPPGTTPFARLYVRTCIPTQEGCPTASGLDVGEYLFRIDAVNITVASPDQCGTPALPGPTEISTRFTIDDGVNPPVTVVVPDHPWNCFFQNNRLNVIRAQ